MVRQCQRKVENRTLACSSPDRFRNQLSKSCLWMSVSESLFSSPALSWILKTVYPVQDLQCMSVCNILTILICWYAWVDFCTIGCGYSTISCSCLNLWLGKLVWPLSQTFRSTGESSSYWERFAVQWTLLDVWHVLREPTAALQASVKLFSFALVLFGKLRWALNAMQAWSRKHAIFFILYWINGLSAMLGAYFTCAGCHVGGVIHFFRVVVFVISSVMVFVISNF